eukprot:1551713-Pyramimonas_sp.AAC.1
MSFAIAIAFADTTGSFARKASNCVRTPPAPQARMVRSRPGSHQVHKLLSLFFTRAGFPGNFVLKMHMSAPDPRQQCFGVTMVLNSSTV